MTLMDRADDAAWESRFAAIEKEADHILKTEGAFRVNGIDFVLAGDAYMARMLAAEQIVAKRDAIMDRYIARGRTVRGEMAVTDGAEKGELVFPNLDPDSDNFAVEG